MKRILKYIWNYKSLVIIPSIAMLISIIIDMFNPYLNKIMVDNVLGNKEVNLLWIVLSGLAVISLSRSALGYFKEYAFDVLSAKINVDIKQDLFDYIQGLSFSYFDSMNTGELMSRIGEDVDNIWRAISFGLRLFVENVLYFVISAVILFYLNYKLALICILIMAPIAYIAIKFEKQIGESYEKISDQGAILNTTAQENIAGVRLVKAFARERHEILKFLEMNKQSYNLTMEQSNIMAKYIPRIDLLTNIAIVAMICLGGVLVINGEISLGILVAFYGYIWNLIWPMRNLGWLTNMLAQTNASVKKIFKIFNTISEIKDNDNAVQLKNMKGDIKLNNVGFKYNEETILRDINIDVKSGGTIAIMGTTGSGKSSIINLIGRYYDVYEGSVTIDDINVKDLALNTLRSQMAVISQDTFLFSDTIEQNIKMGNPHATMEDIREACQNACALDFIDEFEDGFNTIIGERGIGLSGGQKQRISIARALVRKGKILILDDATSAIDMETEYELLKKLKATTNKTTTFIIAHRISAVKNADHIIYVENGSIIERGTHEELLALHGKYYCIYQDQFKDFQDIESKVVV